LHFDKLSANGSLIISVVYPFVLSLSKHERIIIRGSLLKKGGSTWPNDLAEPGVLVYSGSAIPEKVSTK
jgi:hypothetical protein